MVMTRLHCNRYRFKTVLTIIALGLAVVDVAPARADDTTDQQVIQQPGEDVDEVAKSRHGNGDYASLPTRHAKPEALFQGVADESGWLQRHGFLVLLDNTNEFMGAVTPPTGGVPNLRQGASNAGQYAASVTTDWYKLAGIKGLSTRVITVGRYGTTANRMFGDFLAHSSEIYGGGGNVAVHLVMAYAEQHLAHNRLQIAAGRMSQLSDFATGGLFCVFLNNSFCGRPKAASDSAYVSSYPSAVWAARLRVHPKRRLYIQLGVYFTENGLYAVQQHRTGFKFNGANIVGQIFPIEAGWDPAFGRHKHLSGHYKLGASIENVTRQSNNYLSTTRPFPDRSFTLQQKTGAWAAWLLADQKIMTFHPNAKANVTLLGGVLLNDPQVALRDRQIYGGIVVHGLWSSRPDDEIGLALSTVHISPQVQRLEAYLSAQGTNLPNRATGVQRTQMVIEANYAAKIGRSFVFQPDFQYYHHPNGQQNLRDAVMLGFRAHLEIF